MSNFLNHLIARASQQAPVLERRQPALFEPVGSWQAPPAQPAGESDRPAPAAQPTATLSAIRRAPAPDSVEQSEAVGAVVAEPETMSVQSRSTVPATRQERERMPSPPTDHIESDERADPPAAPAPRAATAVVRGLEKGLPPVAPQIVARGELRAAAVAVDPAARRNRPRLADDSPRRQDATVESEAVSQASATRQAQERVDTATRAPTSVLLPAAPRIAQAIQLARTGQAQAAAAVAAIRGGQDTVQVTIGRVEVRAVASAERPAARVAKPAAPRLTLDDYLRQRNGGRR